MSVPVEIPISTYLGDGTTTAFSIPFEYERPAYVLAKKFDTLTGLEVNLISGVDYSVTGTTVTMIVAPLATDYVIVYRLSPRSQTTVYDVN